MPPVARTPLGYRPALDGVRGLAILAVMIYHSGSLDGGWLGVDVFFTLSGFLITTLLIEEREATARIALGAFYRRRAVRLLPALVLVVTACTVRTAWTTPVDVWTSATFFALAVLFYVGNWAAIESYNQGLLGHTWSLSIEEQFYLLWPPALAALVPRLRYVTVFLGLVALATLSVGYRVVAALDGPDIHSGKYLYLGTLTHADGILIGCATACLLKSGLSMSPRTRRAIHVLSIGALATVVALVAVVPLGYYFTPYVPTTVAAAATALMIADIVLPGSWLAPALRIPPLVWFGQRSYGLYLWHVPVFVMAEAFPATDLPYDPTNVIPAWLAALAIAAVSFHFIERPLLRSRGRPGWSLAAPLRSAAATRPPRGSAEATAAAGSPARRKLQSGSRPVPDNCRRYE